MHVLTIKEPTNKRRQNQFVQIGVPLPQGEYFDVIQIKILDDNNHEIQAYIRPLILWPDNSVKWGLLAFDIDLDPGEEKKLSLQKNALAPQKVINRRCIIQPDDNRLVASTENFSFSINLKHYDFLQAFAKNSKELTKQGFCELLTSNHGELKAVVEDFSYSTRYGQDRPLFAEARLTGSFQSADGETVINFEASYRFHHALDTVNCSFKLHNPMRAAHPDGIWDLGEENSLYIQSFAMGFEVKEIEVLHCKLDEAANWQTIIGQNLNIYQESSGGEHWDSPIHKNKDNIVPLTNRGFIFKQGGKTETGLRASPTVQLNNNQQVPINLHIENFWQNFPKAIDIQNKTVRLELFPSTFPDDVELQPGEQKTQTFIINLGNTDWTARPAEITLNPEWINHCNALPFHLTPAGSNPLDAIIKEGLDGNCNFFAKREAIDEYGWRNFGELFADHETADYQGNELFISHYNNQYDPIYGFLMQYLKTGDNRWFTLADDLARHVVDIDIYHTVEDKDDYNGGLFWHTDHYTDAGTSTHRSYSKHQPKDVYMDHAGGGGPGGQHGYTTGLLYHFLLTGEEASKKAVFQLTKWLTNYYEGDDSILDLIKSVKNHNRIDLKNVFTDQYPLDRGTGNYVNGLLDKFIITNSQSVLKQAATVIQNTASPADVIKNRNLDNIEKSWFYIVFLQSICRFIYLKNQQNEFDYDYHFARKTLIHYADWIVENEYFYLDQPDILEYPNHTWAAQELRKVSVLVYASKFSLKNYEKYKDKAEYFLQRVIESLKEEPTRSYTRILVVLMQNIDLLNCITESRTEIKQLMEAEKYPFEIKAKKTNKLVKFISKYIRRTLKFSPAKELNWLKKNLN